MEVLTPYAFSFVLKQIELCEKVNIPENAHLNEMVEVISSSTTVKVSQSSCECSFWTWMQLPCRHIFALRKATATEMFDSNLFAARWRMDYYQSKHCVLKDSGMPSASTTICVEKPCSTVNILSQGQKYRKAFNLCQQISSVISEVPMRQFTSRMEVLNLVLQSWKDGMEISVQPVDYGNDKPGTCVHHHCSLQSNALHTDFLFLTNVNVTCSTTRSGKIFLPDLVEFA